MLSKELINASVDANPFILLTNGLKIDKRKKIFTSQRKKIKSLIKLCDISNNFRELRVEKKIKITDIKWSLQKKEIEFLHNYNISIN
jgi:hypothetical protein